MRIRWTDSALADLEDALDYIAVDNPKAARKIARTIRKSVLLLNQFPNVGRAGRVNKTRELPVSQSPYVIIYAVHGGNKAPQINILRILHEKRNWPSD